MKNDGLLSIEVASSVVNMNSTLNMQHIKAKLSPKCNLGFFLWMYPSQTFV